jgi:A/G-specific adenine glycosylase
MPWKGEKDPYKIWISEIILQQTRVAQGLEYYNRFIRSFPTVHHLAKATEQNVYKHWEGLGYYSRCRNLIESAKYISKELKGSFPSSYGDIIKLNGVGDYTASAIASFAFNQPHAVLDGNVFRVLSRYFGINTPIDSKAGKQQFRNLALQLLDKKQPGIYNQAIMDFGAEVCKPKADCTTCPLAKECVALASNLVSTLPVKQNKVLIKERWIYYFLVKYKDKYYIRKRTGKDIWHNLYEFILIETKRKAGIDRLFSLAVEIIGIPYKIKGISGVYNHKLTHQSIRGQFVEIEVNSLIKTADYQLVSSKKLKELALPKFINSYLKDRNLSLNLSLPADRQDERIEAKR